MSGWLVILGLFLALVALATVGLYLCAFCHQWHDPDDRCPPPRSCWREEN